MIEIYIDGASSGDPGPAGAGISIHKSKGNVEKISKPLGMVSNHEAEFLALIIALEYCIENEFNVVSIKTDSQLVERAVENKYIKNKAFKIHLDKALLMIDKIELFFIKWIPTKQNKADQLAKQAIRLNKEV
ncbi:ribonuclease HI [Lottiidibacillus patelloidae]|uniref:Ribonuclease HI n=1 Tax=Lottiidibacillus patelloidae TaxID=2670334 RepID=A0A263BW81_9BACI|nr:reverse transcriptase-like protein [Lottiidibacillus patelloidae]OZM57446.1 ribonuclease HI [Lottiidibacillus patelloidae]